MTTDNEHFSHKPGEWSTCPICEATVHYAALDHRCSKKRLSQNRRGTTARSRSAIDSANERAEEPHPLADPMRRAEAERIAQGFAMMDDDYEPDGVNEDA